MMLTRTRVRKSESRKEARRAGDGAGGAAAGGGIENQRRRKAEAVLLKRDKGLARLESVANYVR